MSNLEEFELTKKQRFIGNLAAGIVVFVCGLFLLLCGTGLINLSIKAILVGSLLAALGLIFLATGIIQKNNISIWLCFAFLVPALVEVLVKSTNLSYANLYPLYIAIPAIASFFTMLYSKNWRSHYFAIALFGIIAIIFSLQSSGVLGWAVVLPLFIILAGLCVIGFAFVKSKISDDEE